VTRTHDRPRRTPARALATSLTAAALVGDLVVGTLLGAEPARAQTAEPSAEAASSDGLEPSPPPEPGDAPEPAPEPEPEPVPEAPPAPAPESSPGRTDVPEARPAPAPPAAGMPIDIPEAAAPVRSGYAGELPADAEASSRTPSGRRTASSTDAAPDERHVVPGRRARQSRGETPRDGRRRATGGERAPAPSPGTRHRARGRTQGRDTSGASVPTPPESHTVVAGEHVWGIAAEQLATRTGRPVSDVGAAEIAPYWVRVCMLNAPHLRSGDPNLVYPGEVIELPPT
jgi:hypothetical protein